MIRRSLLAATLLLCACASSSPAPRPQVTAPVGTIYDEASTRLSARIPADAKVAIAPPSIDVRHAFGGDQSQRGVKAHLAKRAEGYPIRLEGAVAEGLNGNASLLTRTHLEPILKEHELQWSLLTTDQGSRTKLATLTSVDVLITWNVCTAAPRQDELDYRKWTYEEEWTMQVLRIETGELLGSVTLRRPAVWSW